MNSSRLTAGLCALTLAAVTLYPAFRNLEAASPPVAATRPISPPQQGQPRPRIDVVFVLDTTGSMGGLIEAAKEKIWSIATTMAQAEPAPEIRVGLVAYRDRGDQYVTQTFDLTTDLDSMYATLMDFRADGGGDGPEAVNQALHQAVTGLSWRQDQAAYQVIFLVGDAPPHMDYQDDVKYPTTLALAKARGIIVNTIQCGDDVSATEPWRQIAALGAGQSLQVAQNGSAVAITTPFDERLATLARELDETRLYYGDAATQEAKARKVEATRKLEAGASVASKARRATYNATASGSANLLGEAELVEAVTRGKVDVEKLDAASLPAPLKKLSPSSRVALVKEKAEQRARLQREIADTAARRNAFLADQVAATPGAEASLDQQLFGTVRDQAATKGLRYAPAAAPAY